MMTRLAWLAAAGAAGTLARYGMQGVVQRHSGGTFPWGTLVVNVLGCFLFGVVWAAATERHLLGSEARIVLLMGFMGAFTTFSSFAFETGELLRSAQWVAAAGNVCLQNALGVAGLLAGMIAGRVL